MLYLMVSYISCKNLTFAICSSSTEGSIDEHKDSSPESTGTVALSVLGAVQAQKTFLPQRINAGDGVEIC